MSLLYSQFYIAQAYSCGTYGQAAYNQCETSDQSQPAQNPQSNTGGVAGPTSQAQPSDQPPLQDTTTPDQSEDILEPTETTEQPSGPVEDTGPMAGIGFDFILLWAFIIALLIALIIFLFKRRRKRDDLDQFSGPTNFPQT